LLEAQGIPAAFVFSVIGITDTGFELGSAVRLFRDFSAAAGSFTVVQTG
jgi:hypothetical protein